MICFNISEVLSIWLMIYSGSALVEAGPAGVLIDYSIVGCVVFLVMSALGEMVSYMPLPREPSKFRSLSV